MNGNGDGRKNENTPKAEAGVNPQHVIDVLKYCVRQYLAEQGLDTEQAEQVTIEDFVTWCLQEGLPVSAREEILSETYSGTGTQPGGSRITLEAIEVVWGQLQNPYAAVKLLWPVWEWLVLKRPPFKARLKTLALAVCMEFRDGKVLETRIATVLENKPLTEGFLCSLIKNQILGMVATILVNGVDPLHEKYAVPAGVKPASTVAPENGNRSGLRISDDGGAEDKQSNTDN